MLWSLYQTIIAVLFVLLRCDAYTPLTDSSLHAIPDPGVDFDIDNGKLLAPILQPRVPGTPGSEAVRRHFAEFFAAELPQWKVTYQNSTSRTPATGDEDVPFVNLVVTREPPWAAEGEVGYLTLVAHYDSKRTPEGFIGATDSAAPCAMLLHVARSLEPALKRKWDSMDEMGVRDEKYGDDFEEHKGVQIIFLDGEEAFNDAWTHQDSIYGAKSLADEMENTFHPALSTYRNALSSISIFMLLDLLGSAKPYIPSYFRTTDWAYRNLATVADRLEKTSSAVTNDIGSWFEKSDTVSWLGGFVEDDHLPFMARGINILHIIPHPFPRVWHNMNDDGKHLDIPTCKDWAVLVTAFAAEWMDLEGHMTANERVERRDPEVKVTISKTEL